jgi:hypothetical protein
MFKEIGVVDRLEDLRTDEGKKLIIEMKRLIRANKVIIYLLNILLGKLIV